MIHRFYKTSVASKFATMNMYYIEFAFKLQYEKHVSLKKYNYNIYKKSLARNLRKNYKNRKASFLIIK